MSKIVDTKIKLLFSVSSVFIALVIGFMGVIFGNKPIVKPNLLEYKSQVWNTRVSSCDLVNWIEDGKRSFFLVGFRKPKDIKSKGEIKTSDCIDKKYLDDVKWLRRRFPNIRVPLLVYGEDNKESIEAAAKLRYYGYNAMMLDGGYNKFVKDFKTQSSKGSKVSQCKDEIGHPFLRKARYHYFTGFDKNLGKKKKAATQSLKSLSKKQSFSVEGC